MGQKTDGLYRKGMGFCPFPFCINFEPDYCLFNNHFFYFQQLPLLICNPQKITTGRRWLNAKPVTWCPSVTYFFFINFSTFIVLPSGVAICKRYIPSANEPIAIALLPCPCFISFPSIVVILTVTLNGAAI
jgi:hypothetical protein